MNSLLRNVRTGTRLGLAFGLLLLLIVLVAGIGALQISRVQASAEDLASNWLPSVQVLGEIRSESNSARRLAFRFVIESDAKSRGQTRASHDEVTDRHLPELFERYEKLISSADERALYEQLRAQWTAYMKDEAAVLVMAQRPGADAFEQTRDAMLGAASDRFNEAMVTVDKLVDLNLAGSDTAVAGARADYRRALWIALVLGVAAVLTGVALALVITRSIVGPIAGAVEVARTVARGDLSADIRVEGRDEAAELQQALRDMNTQLGQVVRQVRGSSDSIATGSAEIAVGNADLSQRTEHQASNLEQTAASMEELIGIVRNNTESAQQANTLAGSTAEAATQGGEVVAQVVRTMEEIAGASHRIADIIGVIDGIAFQTNILALNAAVEAARAGEQGRGFAVVASEVRSLAQRSADAAKEIRALIGASVEKVEAGSRQAATAGQSMEAILTQVRRVRDLVSEISNASTEQSNGIAQVGDAVNQLDQVTQQNAALVEQSAAAAESLKHQAQVLARAVAVFTLAGEARAASAHAPQRSSADASPASWHADELQPA